MIAVAAMAWCVLPRRDDIDVTFYAQVRPQAKKAPRAPAAEYRPRVRPRLRRAALVDASEERSPVRGPRTVRAEVRADGARLLRDAPETPDRGMFRGPVRVPRSAGEAAGGVF